MNGGTGGSEAIYTINATNSTINNVGTIAATGGLVVAWQGATGCDATPLTPL